MRILDRNHISALRSSSVVATRIYIVLGTSVDFSLEVEQEVPISIGSMQCGAVCYMLEINYLIEAAHSLIAPGE